MTDAGCKKFDGKKLFEARKSVRISRHTLAKRAGCTPMSIYNWEVGRYAPRSDVLARIAEALKRNIGYFYSGDSDAPR